MADTLLITSTLPSPADAALIIVRAGRKRLATISAKDAAALLIGPHQPPCIADAALLSALALADEFVRARAMLVRKINTRPLTTAVAEKLAVKAGYSHQAIARALAALAASGLLNDAALAHNFAEAQLAHKVASPALLADKLIRKGVESETAHTAAAAAASDRDLFEEACLLVADKSMRQTARSGPVRDLSTDLHAHFALRRRMFGLLARRGFDSDFAERVLTEVLGPASDAEVSEYAAEDDDRFVADDRRDETHD